MLKELQFQMEVSNWKFLGKERMVVQDSLGKKKIQRGGRESNGKEDRHSEDIQ